MDVIDSPREMQEWSRARRIEGRKIGFVPTMGALHPGHLSLVDMARENADCVVVSTFVNPLQFDDKRDFDSYPQTRESDEAMCRDRRVDVVYRPTPEAMYPPGFSTMVHVSDLSEVLEGASRPGHFDGVATVVVKLLHAVDPDCAVFGAKDFQQVAVIRRMTADLSMSVRILLAPTMREPDGLAMSSRNVRLSPDARRAAAGLSRGLIAAQSAFLAGVTDSLQLVDLVAERASASPLVAIDYVAIVDPHTLKPVAHSCPDDVILVAAMVDGVRLIDNVVIGDLFETAD